MEKSFDKLFDEAALDLFESLKQSKGVLPFLSKRLPLKYELTNGVLVNPQKDFSSPQLLLFDALSCPKLYLDSQKQTALIPRQYIYGTITYIPQINQESLATTIDKTNAFIEKTKTLITKSSEEPTPLNIWFAEDLAPFISLDDLEDRLLAEENPPDLVLVLNRGLLVTLNKHTISQIFSLEQKPDSQSFDKAITANLVDITQKTLTTKYFKMGATLEYQNLFYFYIFLLNLLQNQSLPTEEISAEMVAIWGR